MNKLLVLPILTLLTACGQPSVNSGNNSIYKSPHASSAYTCTQLSHINQRNGYRFKQEFGNKKILFKGVVERVDGGISLVGRTVKIEYKGPSSMQSCNLSYFLNEKNPSSRYNYIKMTPDLASRINAGNAIVSECSYTRANMFGGINLSFCRIVN